MVSNLEVNVIKYVIISILQIILYQFELFYINLFGTYYNKHIPLHRTSQRSEVYKSRQYGADN